MRFARIILFIVFISLVRQSILYAQIITLLNESTKEPIENMALYNSDHKYSTLTNAFGKANITHFADSDSIFFQHPSYKSCVYLKSDLILTNTLYISRKVFPIEEYVISASKYQENKKALPFMVDVLGEKELRENVANNSADLLLSSGNIAVQKSQGGGGSPILRGFEANKILLVVDGVRMNNAIYRSGHLQNAITIDNSILERAEIIYGPTSLIYGSDALGGVIHYYTRDAKLATDSTHATNVRAGTQFSTANSGKSIHFDMNLGSRKIASLTSVSFKSFGDIKMGENSRSEYGNYAQILNYVARINGVDSTIANPEPFLQKNTAYSQIDILQKVKYSPSKYFDWILNIQYSTSSKIDRLDFLNDYGSDGTNLNYAEYYYGPQNRLFVSLKSLVKKDKLLYTNITSNLAYQRIDEDRFTRKFRKNDLMAQKEDVDVLTFNQDYLKILSNSNRIYYGLEATYNKAISTAYYQNILDKSLSPAPTRYPDGGSYSWSAAAYLSYKWAYSEKYFFSGGFRYQHALYHSEFIGGILPYESINISNPALTGSLSMVYHPSTSWQINTVVSTGFRSPNIDDYGKVRAKDGEVTVPNPDLNPEYSYNFEAGLSKLFEKYFKVSATAYYTLLSNAIIRTGYTLNGQDSLMYDGDNYRMITNSNASNAFIRGLSVALNSEFSEFLVLSSSVNFTYGRDKSNNDPLAHIPPVFGRTKLYYSHKKFASDLSIDYNGWKYLRDFSPLGEDNESEGTIDGFPSWYTVNFKSIYSVNQNLQVQVSVENIFDSLYKTFASGVAAPGRNFIFSIKLNI